MGLRVCLYFCVCVCICICDIQCMFEWEFTKHSHTHTHIHPNSCRHSIIFIYASNFVQQIGFLYPAIFPFIIIWTVIVYDHKQTKNWQTVIGLLIEISHLIRVNRALYIITFFGWCNSSFCHSIIAQKKIWHCIFRGNKLTSIATVKWMPWNRFFSSFWFICIEY